MTTLFSSTATRLGALHGADEPRAGGKAANCARLLQAGFPAPDGLVVLAGSDAGDIAALPSHPWFDQQPEGARYAVRSSGIGEDGAGQSFAGVHRTELDVRREDVPAAVAGCLASAHDAQALDYRRAKGLSTDAIAMGVLIQPMVAARVSGVAFTVNPVTGDESEVVINASWGLGEALVSGQVDPDEFVVRKADGRVHWRRLGDKGQAGQVPVAALDDAQLAELARLVVRIERHYGAAQDVEWCHDGTAFWIVQSRPVTTVAAPAGPDIEWTRANLAEVLPDITSPQALDAFDDLLNAAERRHLGRLMAPESEAGPIAKAFHGRLCFNLTQLRHISGTGGVAPAAMLRAMGHAEAIRPEDEIAPKARLPLAAIPDVARIVWQHGHPETVIRAHRRRTDELLQRLRADDLPRLDDADLWASIDRWNEQAVDFLQPVLLLGNVLFHEQRVEKACAIVGHSAESLIYPHLAAGERSVSAQQAFDLVALAELARRDASTAAYLRQDGIDLAGVRQTLSGTPFLAAFERFLAAYGHRGRYEYDWSLPRYFEDAAPIFQALKGHLDAPTASVPLSPAAPETAAAEAWTAFMARLSRWQRWTMAPAVRRALTRVKQYYVWREQVRSDLARVVNHVRARHLVLAERFARRGWIAAPADYFMLHLREVAELIAGTRAAATLPAIVAARAAEQHRQRQIRLPYLLRESQLPALIRCAHVTGATDGDDLLTGYAVSPGAVEAEVVVVRDPGDFGRMRRGAILVAPATDPSWTPLFTLASGVIVEIGGVLSHASTIAREYGLPALANVQQATRRLRTGDRVRLDADAGVVQRVAHAPARDGGRS